MDTIQELGRCAVIGAGRLGTALAAALRDAGLTVDGPLGRGADADGADVVLLCVPDAEIAAAAAAVAPRGALLVGHCSGATALDAAAPARGLLAAPADDRPAARAPSFAGAGAPSPAPRPRALAVAEALADAPRDGRRRGRRRRPRRLPRRRLDRLELPRHARGRRRAPGRRRRRAASCSSRSSARPSRTGRRSAPSGRSPARSPAATRRPSPASATRSPSARPSCWSSSTPSPPPPATLAAAGAAAR